MTLREQFKGKPSGIVRAMIDGLRHRYPGQVVNMNSYGAIRGETCYGCAATWATQRMVGRQLEACEVNAESRRWTGGTNLPWSTAEIRDFESAVDLFRMACPGEVFLFAGCHDRYPEFKTFELPALGHSSWEENLPAYEKFAEALEAAGL